MPPVYDQRRVYSVGKGDLPAFETGGEGDRDISCGWDGGCEGHWWGGLEESCIHAFTVYKYSNPCRRLRGPVSKSALALSATAMYNGIGLTTPRGRCVSGTFVLRVSDKPSLVVQMAMCSAIFLHCGHIKHRLTVERLGTSLRQNTESLTKPFSSMRRNEK